MVKICKQCGKSFKTENSRKRLCDACRINNRKKHTKEYCVKYSKENRNHILIAKDDYEKLVHLSKVTNTSIREVVHMLVGLLEEEQ